MHEVVASAVSPALALEVGLKVDVEALPDPVRQALAAGQIDLDDPATTRTAVKRYRTTPLRGAWQHPPYFHDGSAATLLAVVEHYNGALNLGLTAAQRADLAEYLKSL